MELILSTAWNVLQEKRVVWIVTRFPTPRHFYFHSRPPLTWFFSSIDTRQPIQRKNKSGKKKSMSLNVGLSSPCTRNMAGWRKKYGTDMKHISHCEFSWSWSLDPREDNSSNMRLWEIFVPAHFLTPAGSFEMPTKAEKSADRGRSWWRYGPVPNLFYTNLRLNCFTRQCTDEKIQWGRWWPRNARWEGGGDSTSPGCT